MTSSKTKKKPSPARTTATSTLAEEAKQAVLQAKAKGQTNTRTKRKASTFDSRTLPNKGASPVLWLVGVCAVGVLVYYWVQDDEPIEATEQVQRAVYQTQADCVLDWGDQTLCTGESGSDTPTSDASSGHYSSGAHYYGHWFYGPFYTQNGTVYIPSGGVRNDPSLGNRQGTADLYTYDRAGNPHKAGSVTNAPLRAQHVEQATVRAHAMQYGTAQSVRGLSMRAVSQRLAPSAVRSRGGFFRSSGRSGGG